MQLIGYNWDTKEWPSAVGAAPAESHRSLFPMTTQDDSTAPSEFKVCSRCGEAKPHADYFSDRRKKDGCRQPCKPCKYAVDRSYMKLYLIKYRQSRLEELRAADRRRNAANREGNRERSRRWRAENPERKLANVRARQIRKAGNAIGESFTRREIFDRDRGQCHLCGKTCDPSRYHVDHLVPLSMGGEHSRRNVAVAHPECNLRRGASGPAQTRLWGDI